MPVTEQLRDEVAAARRRLGGNATPEQREALRLIAGDTLTIEAIGRVAAAFAMSAERLVQLTNSVHEVGTTGGPG